MQLLVAYAFDRQPGSAEVEAALRRVESHYEPLWRVPVERRGVDAGRVGLHLWDAVHSPWRWPSWQQDDQLVVATLYLPLGYDRIVGNVAPERAALPLARALADRPSSILELTAPYVIASVEPRRGRLRLHTDGLGVGRLYELRAPGGWVWSNRPVAACLFAGIRAEPDRDGWRILAASDWFIGDRTPFARVFAVQGGETIDYDTQSKRQVHSRIDALRTWGADRSDEPGSAKRFDEVAQALIDLMISIERMSPASIVCDLSGGRDSRIVAAAALAAGLSLTLNTGGAEAGEAEVAERLVSALPPEMASRVTHRVSRPTVGGAAPTFGLPLEFPIVPNALAWHRSHEGLRSPTYLPTTAPTHIDAADHIAMGGAGGEIAHGHFYPSDYAELEHSAWAYRVDRLTEHLGESLLGPWGVSPAARETAMARARHTLEEALIGGFSDASALDYFYAVERLRRWGTTAERCGNVSPLLVPEFVQAALVVAPDERRLNTLQQAVTARLMPDWEDVPYFKRSPRAIAPKFSPRLGRASDREVISAIVSDSSAWSDGYDPKLVAQSWQSIIHGRSRPADERLLQRVIWRAVFDDFLNEVNDEPGVARLPLEFHARMPRIRPVERGRRFTARGLRKLARMIEPRA